MTLTIRLKVMGLPVRVDLEDTETERGIEATYKAKVFGLDPLGLITKQVPKQIKAKMPSVTIEGNNLIFPAGDMRWMKANQGSGEIVLR